MSWKDKKVLVTGAGGFIGSHLAERLVQEGARVRAFVHYNALGSWGWLDDSHLKDEMEVVAGDITDSRSVQQALSGNQIVFHLAALIAIPYSYRAPRSFVRTNIEGTLNILSAALEVGVERVVHTSTSEVYGTAQRVPIDELHPLRGQSPYSATKIGADKIAEAFCLSYKLPVVTLRPFNTFGPRQSARAIIPTIVTQCLSGSVLKLGNLMPTRDLNFVTNTVNGFILAGKEPKAEGRTINIGSGEEISIGSLAQMIATRLGRTIEIDQEDVRLRPAGSEVERLVADNTLAREILHWKPEVGLSDGLNLTIEWFRENIRKYRQGVYVV
jgi:NAD dependent epimerase/dehydratase